MQDDARFVATQLLYSICGLVANGCDEPAATASSRRLCHFVAAVAVAPLALCGAVTGTDRWYIATTRSLEIEHVYRLWRVLGVKRKDNYIPRPERV